MLCEVTPERAGAMTEREHRWLENVKKAFYESDRAMADGRAQDICFPELCKAIDTAKTLRRSLLGRDPSHGDNRRRFIEFLDLEIAIPGLAFDLTDARTGERRSYSYSGLVYDIRCMVHENENLNAAEKPEHQILLDWNMGELMGVGDGDRLRLNARKLWMRLREVLAKFITWMDSLISESQGGGIDVSIIPPLGSIRPKSSR
jgi:hypothetical protein